MKLWSAYTLNSLPKNKILHWSKFKALVDDKIKKKNNNICDSNFVFGKVKNI